MDRLEICSSEYRMENKLTKNIRARFIIMDTTLSTLIPFYGSMQSKIKQLKINPTLLRHNFHSAY